MRSPFIYSGVDAKLVPSGSIVALDGTPYREDMTRYSTFQDDFDGGGTGNGWQGRNSGTGSGSSQGTVPDTNTFGTALIATGTTTTGFGGQERGVSSILLGAAAFYFRTRILFTALSTVTDEYLAVVGLHDSITGGAATDGVYFIYDRANNGNFWATATTSNSTLTTTVLDGSSGNPTAAVAANTWVYVSCVINAAATSAIFSINGVAVKTHTTNIPSGAGRSTGANRFIIKSAGTSNRTLTTDWWEHYFIPSTAR